MRNHYPKDSYGLGIFLSDLQRQRTEQPSVKARIAKLRHAAENPMQHPELFYLLDDVVPESFHSTWQENCFLSVPCLFALHLQHTDKSINLGDALYALRRSTDAKSSLDLRFNGLINADSEDVYQLLRPLIMRLENAKVEINFAKLYDDLVNWRSEDKRIQRAWAKSYYRNPNPEESDDENVMS